MLGATALLAPVLVAAGKFVPALNESASVEGKNQRLLSTTATYNYDQSLISLHLSAAGNLKNAIFFKIF